MHGFGKGVSRNAQNVDEARALLVASKKRTMNPHAECQHELPNLMAEGEAAYRSKKPAAEPEPEDSAVLTVAEVRRLPCSEVL